MEDYGIFEVKRNKDGRYLVSEQIGGETKWCDSVNEVAEYIRGSLAEVEDECP